MYSNRLRVPRYLRAWLTDRASVSAVEFEVDRGDLRVPVTLLTPRETRRPLPGWVVLHGITRPGRNHSTLVRFTRALAATGCAVAIPEVPEWRELYLAPHVTAPTVCATIRGLAGHVPIRQDRLGLIGFSFGAPQALRTAAHPESSTQIRGVVGFGGYCDLERTVRFGFTGEHEQDGCLHRLRPDPYGRWVVGANYLTHVPGYEDAADVAEALRSLAMVAGDRGVMSWDPGYDPVKERLRSSLSAEERGLFDLFAPPSSLEPPPRESGDIAKALAEAARRVDPDVDATPVLGDVARPVHLLHGRHDHLIPYTEGLRLGRALSPGVLERATVTSLFGHSTQDPLPGPVDGMREGVRFLQALAGILRLV